MMTMTVLYEIDDRIDDKIATHEDRDGWTVRCTTYADPYLVVTYEVPRWRWWWHNRGDIRPAVNRKFWRIVGRISVD